ncbi:hypothetical protein ON010_g13860 [Phytophthora cinnamomi]|nr:hypothetical protein ON010_g13860 [Phytophthora cinnamomi]
MTTMVTRAKTNIASDRRYACPSSITRPTVCVTTHLERDSDRQVTSSFGCGGCDDGGDKRSALGAIVIDERAIYGRLGQPSARLITDNERVALTSVLADSNPEATIWSSRASGPELLQPETLHVTSRDWLKPATTPIPNWQVWRSGPTISRVVSPNAPDKSTVNPSPEGIHRVVDKVFESVLRQQLRTIHGAPECHHGEISANGVSALMGVLPPLKSTNIFVDIGSSTGTIIGTRNKESITIVFANNLVFSPSTNTALEVFATQEPRLAHVISSCHYYEQVMLAPSQQLHTEILRGVAISSNHSATGFDTILCKVSYGCMIGSRVGEQESSTSANSPTYVQVGVQDIQVGSQVDGQDCQDVQVGIHVDIEVGGQVGDQDGGQVVHGVQAGLISGDALT